MININRAHVETLSKQLNSKQTNGINDSILYPIFSHAHTNFIDTLRSLTTYEMAHWINYSDRWVGNRNTKNNTIGYKRGTILFIDLGSGNFGHEPSFTHPAIVLAQTKDSILIAPCSSKKYGKGFPEIVDATSADGFSPNTGIQTYSMRWVSKNRVLSIIGKTSSAILDKVDEKMLKLIPGHYKKLSEKEQQMHALNNHIIALEKEISELKAKLAAALSENNQAKNEV